MAVVETSPFRLTPVAEGRGVSCDIRGCYVGEEPLLTRSRNMIGRELWAPRPQSELEEALSARYGHPIDMSTKVDGLAGIADALNRGDVFRAQLGMLALKLPHPPAPAFVGASSPKLASLLHLTGMLRGGHAFAPPAGDDSGHGRSALSKENGRSQTLAKDPHVIPAQEFLFSEIPLEIPWARPTPPLLPGDLVRPRPGQVRPDMPRPWEVPADQDAAPNLPWPAPRPVPPDWTVPVPREIPGLRKGQLVNPYPEKAECAKEWADAFETCNKKFMSGEFKPGYGGFGADFEKCVRGLVSAECGGNPGDQEPWKRPRPKIDLRPRKKPTPTPKGNPPITA